jgi:Carboxypeptidase regulatory-like domain/TonB-dependent Receptor Plug Domain
MRHYVLVLILFCAESLAAQSITGSLVGTVKDTSDQAVVGAAVTLVQVSTGAERQTKTNQHGDFFFGSLQPGEYKISVTQSGFKRTEKQAVQLSAVETLSVGDLILEVGGVNEAVTVTAQGATVQTASAERSGVVTSQQVENLLIRSRNVMSLLQLLPGVVDQTENDRLDRNWNINVQGNRRNTNSVSLDGVSLNAIGNNFNSVVGVSQDAVAEVKVLLSNYQAEYGRMSGANISLVTKSGTREFHGLGSYFKRHEQFNANNFFNNRLGVAKPRYRFNTWNYNVGGPAYIPKVFNRNRDKLFFFFSQEYWPLKLTQPLVQLTVPTELERAGDFSQSLDLNGRLITITDPVTRQPFQGNRIPTNRIDPNGQALLKVFPKPNFFDRALSAGRYNYVSQTESSTPQRTETLKVDYNATSNNLLSFNFTTYSDVMQRATTGANWPQMLRNNSSQGKALISRYQHIFSPTLVNELNVGYSHRPLNDEVIEEELRRNQRDQVGLTLGQFNPGINPLKLIPNATFGGVTNAANLQIEGRFPLVTNHDIFSLTDSITKTLGTHTLKAGFYFDRVYAENQNAISFNGSFDFGRNANNPLDAGYAYANAILGVFNSYTEPSARPYPRALVRNVEWFVQDNWKATRRLTIDYGVRFYVIAPSYEQDSLISGFVPERFDPKQQVRLIEPRRVNNQRVGANPITGQTYPASLIGAIAPGAGNPVNGIVVPAQQQDYPSALVENRGVHLAPRVGFSFDPFGNGKTAVRGGFGIFYNREAQGMVLYPYTTQPPLVNTPVINYGTLSTLLASSGLLFPSNVLGLDRIGKVPTVMNFSLSVQRNVGAGIVVDVGYVGSLARHLLWQRNLNAIPFGANFDPKNADPTSPGVPLSQAFLRPFPGYGNINFREWASSSNYYSLQVTVNRRFTRGVQFGGSWTWSKALDFNDTDNESVSTLIPVREANYGLASFDRTHVLKINWLWDLPKTGWKSLPARAVLNDWQVSGIASFVSGTPLGIGFSTVSAMDITGSPTDDARIVVTGDPVLPKGERAFSRNFRTEVFQLPARGTYGNAAKTLIRGPGINNWDLAIFKTFPIREQMRFQFRWEMYNAFNHTQFSGLDTAARFDAAGNQVNSRFGEFTSARNPRQMQFALRFYF